MSSWQFNLNRFHTLNLNLSNWINHWNLRYISKIGPTFKELEQAVQNTHRQAERDSFKELRIIIQIENFFQILSISGLNCIWLEIFLSIYLPIFLSIYPPIFLSIYLPIFLSIYLPIFLSIYQPIFLSIYLPIFLSIYLPIFLSIYLPISLSIYLTFS